MADASMATPTSSGAKLPAQKDKQCPFCHQPFTSSSLGRHLDLYIKAKNPKPADDVHDVDEIRRMRSAITRRQARSSQRHDESATSSVKGTPQREEQSPPTTTRYPNILNTPDGAVKTFWNQPNWQATGVINDIPQVPREEQSSSARRRPPSRTGSIKEDLTRRQRTAEERDRGQAAELALKEVLENVRVVNARAHPPSPFDFNFFALSLPQIYLKCLAPPPELLSESPSLSQATWSVEAPDQHDCEVARSWLQDRLHDWRRRRENLRFGNDTLQNGVNGAATIHSEDEAINNEEALYNDHLSKVYRKWTELGETERDQQWRYECARAFAREREDHQATQRRLEQTEQEIALLRNHLGQTNIEVPLDSRSDLTPYVPSLLPLSDRSATFLMGPASAGGASSTSWDFDSMISKWRSRIQSARSSQYPLPSVSTFAWAASAGSAPPPLPPLTTTAPSSSPRHATATLSMPIGAGTSDGNSQPSPPQRVPQTGSTYQQQQSSSLPSSRHQHHQSLQREQPRHSHRPQQSYHTHLIDAQASQEAAPASSTGDEGMMDEDVIDEEVDDGSAASGEASSRPSAEEREESQVRSDVAVPVTAAGANRISGGGVGDPMDVGQ